MTYRQLRSLVQFHLRDIKADAVDDNLVDVFVNEGLRQLAVETLLLEEKTSSLTYNSSLDGFTLPTDFIKVKSLHWQDPESGQHEIEYKTVADVYKKRNDWLNLNESSGDYLTPLGYSIHEGVIILDSTTTTSPILYYYKYDTALANADDSPSIDSEFHSMIADYALHKITRDTEALALWRDQLRKLAASNTKRAKTARVRFRGL